MSQLMHGIDTSALGWVGSAMTVLFTITFAGWAFWAWAPWNRANMEAAARLPFEDDLGSGE